MNRPHDTPSDLAERLAGLERRYRRLRTTMIVFLVLAATSALGLPLVQAQSSGKQEVNARLLIIRDDAGNRRVLIGINDTGHAGVWVLNEQGNQRVVMSGPPLSEQRGSAGVWVLDENGQQRVTMASGADYAGTYVMQGDDRPRISLFTSNGQAAVQIRDQQQEIIWSAP